MEIVDEHPLGMADHPLAGGGVSDPLQHPPPHAPPPPPPPPPPPERDVVENFLGRPAPARAQHDSVAQTPEGVLTLARAGAWRAAATLSERLLALSHPVDVLLYLRWYHIVALLRLREVGKAEREMALLGDLRSDGWNFEKYPGVYQNKTGTMVPSALRVLHALLPSYSGNHDHALARLYALLEQSASAADETARRLPERSQIVLALVNVRTLPTLPPLVPRRITTPHLTALGATLQVLCAVHDYPNAIAHLEQLIAAVQQHAPESVTAAGDEGVMASGFGVGGDPLPASLSQLLSLLGRVQLQVCESPHISVCDLLIYPCHV